MEYTETEEIGMSKVKGTMPHTLDMALKIGEILQSDAFPAVAKEAIMRDYNRILREQGEKAALEHMERLPIQILTMLATFDDRIMSIMCEETYEILKIIEA